MCMADSSYSDEENLIRGDKGISSLPSYQSLAMAVEVCAHGV